MIEQTILAIDTATENCSVALGYQGQIYLKSQVAPQKHANLVLGMIDELLQEHHLERSNIDAIGFGAGPGSFTGVRIAVSVAQGLGLGLQKEVFGVSDLKLLVANAMLLKGTPSNPCYGLGCIDARMGEVYIALYSYDGKELKSVLSEQVLKPQDAWAQVQVALGEHKDNLVVAGTGVSILNEAASGALSAFMSDDMVLYPQADALIQCAQVEGMRLQDPAEAEPLYCRNEVTWKKIGEQ